MVSTTAQWIKSSYCSDSACVEVARDGETIAVRDGKDRQGPVIRFSRQEWQGFLAGIEAGDYPH